MAQVYFDLLEEPAKRLDDVGEKIGGARKDQWRARGYLLESDLADMEPAEQAAVVKKANVWRPDYEALIAAGAESVAAAAVKIIYDQIAAKPKDASALGRYLQAISRVREALAGAKTVEEVRQAARTLAEDLDWRDTKAISAHRGTHSRPLYFGQWHKQKAEELVKTGWPNADPWRRRYRIREAWDNGWYVWDRRTRRTIGAKIATEAEAGQVAAALYATASVLPEPKSDLPARPHLDHLERVGPDVRQGRDIRPEDFMEAFGFRGVEFGLWAAQDERQKSVNLAFEALHDLAAILGLPTRAISFDGRLALAFGARGSGRASAHYEPLRQVINLTKLRGAGVLAHEWFHALDHYCGEFGRKDAYGSAPRYVSGGHERAGIPAVGLGLPGPVRIAWREVIWHLYTQRVRPEDAVEHYQREIVRLEGWRSHYRAKLEKHPRNAALRHKLVGVEARLEGAAQGIARVRENPALASSILQQAQSTDFHRQAARLCGRHSTGGRSSLGYWERPTEMLARAAESWVFDRLEAEGRRNDYLVHSVEDGRYASGFRGNPYPSGREREDIGAALQVMAAELGLARLWERAPRVEPAREASERGMPTSMAAVTAALDQGRGMAAQER